MYNTKRDEKWIILCCCCFFEKIETSTRHVQRDVKDRSKRDVKRNNKNKTSKSDDEKRRQQDMSKPHVKKRRIRHHKGFHV